MNQGEFLITTGCVADSQVGSVPPAAGWTITVTDYTDPTLTGSVVHFQVIGTDTSLYGIDLTEGDTWTAGVSNTVTAASLADNINNSGIDSHATLIATVLLNVITVTSVGNITALTAQSAALVIAEL